MLQKYRRPNQQKLGKSNRQKLGQTKIFPIKNVANGDTAKKRGRNLVQTPLKKYNLILPY